MAKIYELKQIKEILAEALNSNHIKVNPDDGLLVSYKAFIAADELIKKVGRKVVGTKNVVTVMVASVLHNGNYGNARWEPIKLIKARVSKLFSFLEDKASSVKVSNINLDLINEIFDKQEKEDRDEDSYAVKVAKDAINLARGNYNDLILEEAKELIEEIKKLDDISKDKIKDLLGLE